MVLVWLLNIFKTLPFAVTVCRQILQQLPFKRKIQIPDVEQKWSAVNAASGCSSYGGGLFDSECCSSSYLSRWGIFSSSCQWIKRLKWFLFSEACYDHLFVGTGHVGERDGEQRGARLCLQLHRAGVGGWLAQCFVCWFNAWMVVWSVGCSIDWLVSLEVGWSVGCFLLVGKLVVVRSISLLVGLLIGWLVCKLIVWMVDVGFLVDWGCMEAKTELE